MLSSTNSLVPSENTGIPGNLAELGGPAFQVMGSFLDDLQVNFLLEATQMDRYSSVVQAPKVIVENGHFAVISVTTLFYYVEEVEVTIGEAAGGTEPTLEADAIGTTLGVTASTNDLHYVHLSLSPRISTRAPDADLVWETALISAGSQTVLTQTRPGSRVIDIQTTVSVPDGGTLLLGGLKQTGEIEREAGVPILSKLPIIKRFFSNRSMTKDTFTLLILVKPRIIIREEVEPGSPYRQ